MLEFFETVWGSIGGNLQEIALNVPGKHEVEEWVRMITDVKERFVCVRSLSIQYRIALLLCYRLLALSLNI